MIVINAQNENKITYQEMYPASTQVPLTNITNVSAECVNSSSVSDTPTTQVSRASSVSQSLLSLRNSRDWPNNFEFPSSKLSPLLFKTLNDPLCNLKPIEIKELINVLFTSMLEKPYLNFLTKSIIDSTNDNCFFSIMDTSKTRTRIAKKENEKFLKMTKV